jgi:parallel beta-helix repeat protein
MTNVSNAISSARSGDHIVLLAGSSTIPGFDWSANNRNWFPLAGRFGIPIMTSGITIEGEAGTIILGPTDSQDSRYPRIEADPPNAIQNSAGVNVTGGYANAAFFIGPGVTNVTIRNLEFRNFEVVVGLLQTTNPTLANIYVQMQDRPNRDFSLGADGFIFENNRIINCFSGIQGVGGNDNLTVRNNIIQTVWRQGFTPLGLLRENVAIGNKLFANNLTNSTPPNAIVITGNTISGPTLGAVVLPLLSNAIFVIGSNNTRIESNQIDGYPGGIALGGQGDSAILDNRVSLVKTGITVADGSVNSIPASNTTNAIIRGNTIGNTPGSSQTTTADAYGIKVEGECNLIINNIVGSNPTGAIRYNDRADNNLFLRNVGNVIAIPGANQTNKLDEPLADFTAPTPCFRTVSLPVFPATSCWSLSSDIPGGTPLPTGTRDVVWTWISTGQGQSRSFTFRQNVTVNPCQHQTRRKSSSKRKRPRTPPM